MAEGGLFRKRIAGEERGGCTGGKGGLATEVDETGVEVGHFLEEKEWTTAESLTATT